MNTKKIKNNEISAKFLNLSAPITFNCKFSVTNQENLSKKYYQNILVYDLILKQNYTSIMQLPRVEKIVLNTTSKNYINDKKLILFTLAGLKLISGQKPELNYTRKSIANFKIRQHQLIGCKVVLRKKGMYSFLDKLSKIIFPRIRDYSKNNTKKPVYQDHSSTFSGKRIKLSTYTFGFKNMMIFPELENNFELVDNFNGMNCTFVFSNCNQKNSILVCSGFQLPFCI